MMHATPSVLLQRTWQMIHLNVIVWSEKQSMRLGRRRMMMNGSVCCLRARETDEEAERLARVKTGEDERAASDKADEEARERARMLREAQHVTSYLKQDGRRRA